jgi:uncharacterized RDD family membrane protein YckC
MAWLPDEQLNIGTPENVTFGYEVAGIGSRFLAALVDSLIIVALQVVVYTILIYVLFQLAPEAAGGAAGEMVAGWLVALLLLLSFVLLWGYYIFFEVYWNGQSPGKRWIALRVICSDGSPITLAEAIIRNLIRPIDFLPFAYALGVVVMFVNAQSRRLGDLAAGTLVVRDQTGVTLDSLATKPAQRPYYLAGQPAASLDLPLERLSQADIQLAEDFLRRRGELHNSQELAQRILDTLYRRMALPSPSLPAAEALAELFRIIEAGRNRNARS